MRLFFKTLCVFAAFLMIGCGESKFDEVIPDLPPSQNEEEEQEKPSAQSYNEKYRPQIHFTPAKNWINDPNGMVYVDGVYHLFYQYNPRGNGWGNMSWGHAESTDLIHWTEKPVALTEDHLGAIFSGSAVVDADNTAGFGKDAVIAIYTSAGASQQQSIAYSTDKAATFKTFEGNPVIANNSKPDFRDPKVFWHEESQSWIMSLALGWEYGIELFSSKNLKNWTSLSIFTTDNPACRRGQWECPDLLRFEVDGEEKWVMFVSVNPGGPVSGSGTMYFVGSFDGQQFVADDMSYPLWLDYGTDNYAGVTWSNVPDRTIYIGWMNNWLYAGVVPADPWRSAMTLPRELELVNVDGRYVLASKVVREIENIASEWKTVTDGSLGENDAYQVRLSVDMTKDNTWRLSNGHDEYLEFYVNPSARMIVARRNGSTGASSFSASFSLPALRLPVTGTDDVIELDIYVDRSSVEFITADGTSAMTMIVFPENIYDKIECTSGEIDGKVRSLARIWK